MLKLLRPALLALLVVVAVIVGANQLAVAQSQSKCYFQPGGVGIVAASGCTVNIQSGGTLQIDSGATFSVDGTTASGITRYGSVSATDGLTVTHSLGTTPTSVIVSPSWTGDGSTITQTVYVSNVNSSTFSLEFTTGGVTNTTVYWMAGQ
jgi:hypothetical protein